MTSRPRSRRASGCAARGPALQHHRRLGRHLDGHQHVVFLQSRDLIADSIETVVGAQWHDALIALPGCDKNMPGRLIAMGGSTVRAHDHGGTIKPATARRQGFDIESVFRATASSSPARSTRRARHRPACLRALAPAACTANTMASAIEGFGMALPYSASTWRSIISSTVLPRRPGDSNPLERTSSRATSWSGGV